MEAPLIYNQLKSVILDKVDFQKGLPPAEARNDGQIEK